MDQVFFFSPKWNTNRTKMVRGKIHGREIITNVDSAIYLQ